MVDRFAFAMKQRLRRFSSYQCVVSALLQPTRFSNIQLPTSLMTNNEFAKLGRKTTPTGPQLLDLFRSILYIGCRIWNCRSLPGLASSRTFVSKVGLGWVPGGSKYLRRYDWRCRVHLRPNAQAQQGLRQFSVVVMPALAMETVCCSMTSAVRSSSTRARVRCQPAVPDRTESLHVTHAQLAKGKLIGAWVLSKALLVPNTSNKP